MMGKKQYTEHRAAKRKSKYTNKLALVTLAYKKVPVYHTFDDQTKFVGIKLSSTRFEIRFVVPSPRQ